MHLVSCENPQRVFNKYLNQWLVVPCRKCETCKTRMQNHWVTKLELERRCWKYCYMIFLSYDDLHLPKMFLSTTGSQIVLDDRNGLRHVPVNLDDLVFDSSKDREYLFARLNHPLGLPVASVYDIQLFKKRLNKKIHDRFTKSYANFRSFICAEYGPVSQRPHYHGILFFNEDKIAQNIKGLLFETWKYGNSDALYVEANACQYVASYVNSFDNLPSFYQHKDLKPFYLFSKQPPLGSLERSTEESRKEFIACQPFRYLPLVSGKPFVPVAHDTAYQNRFYPKFVGYDEVSDSLRIRLYGLFCERDWSFEEWTNFFLGFSARYSASLRTKPFTIKDEYRFIIEKCNYFHDVLFSGEKYVYTDFIKRRQSSLNTLYSFYTVSRRVCYQANVFGLTLAAYVAYIDTYWSNYKLYQLKNFYQFQEDYVSSKNSPSDLRVMYMNIDNYVSSSPDVHSMDEYKNMVSVSHAKFEKCSKTKDKNGYFHSKKFKDKDLKQIVENYYGSNYF